MPSMMLTQREPWYAATAYHNYMWLDIPTTNQSSSDE